MGSIHGREPIRQIVVSLAGEQEIAQTLLPGAPDPSPEQLASIANSYRLGGGEWKGQGYNGGLKATAYVVRVRGNVSPWRFLLDPVDYAAQAGLNDDGSFG